MKELLAHRLWAFINSECVYVSKLELLSLTPVLQPGRRSVAVEILRTCQSFSNGAVDLEVGGGLCN